MVFRKGNRDDTVHANGIEALNISVTEENRRAYREMLFTTPGLSKFINGAILFDETIRQRTNDGVPMPEVLTRQGIIPGIKVDKGTIALAHFPGEKITQGLDGLRERLIQYRERGARFTKWRAVIAIGDRSPTRTCAFPQSGFGARRAPLHLSHLFSDS
ncbi:MAG TPA: class I fructose-bisphosphate aldolase [Terrimicrobium sp.]